MAFNNQFYPMYPQSPQQIVRVNGENGARTYQLPPNSSALLLDDTAPLVWLVQTDGAGYKTVAPFSITKYEPEPEPDYKSLMDRLTRLEERLNAEPNYPTVAAWQTESDVKSYERNKGEPGRDRKSNDAK